ncbi:MAG: OmpA family protein [Gammaproteobacteria bacterium]
MKRYLTAIVLGLAATSALAADDESGWNAGVAASFGEYKFDSNQLDDSSVGFKLFTGYRFNQLFGIEGAYHNFGDFNEDLDPPNPGGEAKAQLDGFSLSAMLFAPLASEDLQAYGKAGYYFLDQQVVVDNAVAASNSPDGLLLGAGVRLLISKEFAIRAEGDYFDINDGSLWSLNVGFEYLFGRPARAVPVAAVAAPVAAPVVVAAPPPPPPPPPADSDNDGVVDGRDQCPGTPAGATVNSVGCEEELVLRGVNFSTNSATLTPQDTLILDSIVEILAQRPNFNVEVRGHTDDVGSDADNQRLSQRRAEAVRGYLIDKGIPADKLTAVGKGEADPVAPNDTADGRAQNRRVTLEFTQR